MGTPSVPGVTPAVLIRDGRGADSQYLAALMRANTHGDAEFRELLINGGRNSSITRNSKSR